MMRMRKEGVWQLAFSTTFRLRFHIDALQASSKRATWGSLFAQ